MRFDHRLVIFAPHCLVIHYREVSLILPMGRRRRICDHSFSPTERTRRRMAMSAQSLGRAQGQLTSNCSPSVAGAHDKRRTQTARGDAAGDRRQRWEQVRPGSRTSHARRNNLHRGLLRVVARRGLRALLARSRARRTGLSGAGCAAFAAAGERNEPRGHGLEKHQ